jgi:hypothetical protein
LNFSVIVLLSACGIKLKFQRTFSYDRCRGEDLRVRTPANPVQTPLLGSITNLLALQLFLKKMWTASSKTWDGPLQNVGRTSISPRILLNAFSGPPRFASKSEEAMRRNRGIKEVALRTKLRVTVSVSY